MLTKGAFVINAVALNTKADHTTPAFSNQNLCLPSISIWIRPRSYQSSERGRYRGVDVRVTAG